MRARCEIWFALKKVKLCERLAENRCFCSQVPAVRQNLRSAHGFGYELWKWICENDLIENFPDIRNNFIERLDLEEDEDDD